jgi:hypothetical protein
MSFDPGAALASRSITERFVPPLGSGDYTFVFPQTGSTLITYTLDFTVIPEPSTLVLVLGGLAAVAGARRRPR